MVQIKRISAREILDSRACPTVEAEIILSDGSVGVASVPSGASKGQNEAWELRDGDDVRFHRMGVLGAVGKVNDLIAPALVGMSAYEHEEADSVMIALDGMYNKSNLGANAMLAVSLALARAAACSLKLPLYRYLGGALVNRMPVPMMNILNGGVHADNNLDIQEFMILPIGAPSFSDAVRMGAEVYYSLKNILKSRKLSIAVGDEGGFAPSLSSDAEALTVICEAIEDAGYKVGDEIALGLDVAASEWYSDGVYRLPKRGVKMSADELCDYIEEITKDFPVISVEDGMADTDRHGWLRLGERLRDRKTILVGDDLFVTDARRITEGAKHGIANAVLVKPNQIGTLTEAVEAVKAAGLCAYKTIMSHRSGETEDTFIADLSVAMETHFIKMGAPARSERTAKYNRLMKIEGELFASVYGF